jgi:hypothetical protein
MALKGIRQALILKRASVGALASEMTTISTWMWTLAFGHHEHDEDDPPIIDFEKIRKKAARLTVYCNQNPTHSLTTGAERIMAGK